MKKIALDIQITFCQTDELSAGENRLLEQAVAATDHAYAPYSNFKVGAAALLDDDTVVIGANQENAAYPSGLCAERAALFSAQSQFPDKAVTMLAIAAKNGHGMLKSPITPCGACRQVILEIEDRYRKSVRILLYGTDGVYVIRSAKDILPLSFIADNMENK